MKTASELKSCPFCGSAAKRYCLMATCSNKDCKMHFGLSPNMHTYEQWNTRATDPLVGGLRELLKSIKGRMNSVFFNQSSISEISAKIDEALTKAGGK